MKATASSCRYITYDSDLNGLAREAARNLRYPSCIGILCEDNMQPATSNNLPTGKRIKEVHEGQMTRSLDFATMLIAYQFGVIAGRAEESQLL